MNNTNEAALPKELIERVIARLSKAQIFPLAAELRAALAATATVHDSDCSLHNEPAYPAGPCDCSVATATVAKDGGEPVAWIRKTDITELTDSEPETNGWTPLFATPKPEASAEQPAGEVKPYAYEYGKSNGDGTYSVVIERGDMVKVGENKYENGPPQRAVKDRPVVPLYLAAPISEDTGKERTRSPHVLGVKPSTWDQQIADSSSAAPSDAEEYLRAKYGAYRGHFAWRELEAAFNAGRAPTVPGEPT